MDWGVICNSNETQQAFTSFSTVLLDLFNKCFPKIKVKKKYNTRKPWLTEALRNCIRQKNKLHIEFKKYGTARNEIRYKKYRNRLNHSLILAEKTHYADILDKNKNNIAKTWKILKTIINKNKVKQVQTKFKVNDGSLITDKFAISTKFNDFFVGVGPSLAKNIEKQDISTQSYLGDRISSTIFLAPVSGEELV